MTDLQQADLTGTAAPPRPADRAPAGPPGPPAATPAAGPGPWPATLRWAYVIVIIATGTAIGSNYFETVAEMHKKGDGIATGSDLIVTAMFCVLFFFFNEMMRRGREWGRVVLTIFAVIGLLFTGLGMLGIAGRAMLGGVQVELAVVSFVTSIVALVLMWVPPTNRWMAQTRVPNREISPRLRRWMLTAHIVISVGWLGLVVAMTAAALNGALSTDPVEQESMYRTLVLFDELFLGATSLLSLITGVVGSAGTKWGLLQRKWVATKFYVTIGLMCFGFGQLHPLITKASDLFAPGAHDTAAHSHQVRWMLASFDVVPVLLLVTMTILSVYKPWGLTKRGEQAQAEARSRRSARRAPAAASPTP